MALTGSGTVPTFEDMPSVGGGDKGMQWLVPARNNIQREMLRFLPVMRASPTYGTPTWVILARSLVLGSCFSLWRSVFQASKFDPDWADPKHGLKFLNEIISNNAATYSTELNAWSLTYYIENSCYRLRDARVIAIGEGGIPAADLPEGSMLGKSPRDPNLAVSASMFSPFGEWEDGFLATHKLITAMLSAMRADAARSTATRSSSSSAA